MPVNSTPIIDPDFPPAPITQNHINQVISKWCEDSTPSKFEETGCAVCGQLCLKHNLLPLKGYRNYLHILDVQGVTRVERMVPTDPIRERSGPVIDNTCNMVCSQCRSYLINGKIPRLALANGLWLGEIPDALKGLRFYEKMLIARVRHNKCFVRVQQMHNKMISNVIAFENPIPKVYDILPPPKEEIEEVLAVMFSGSCKPTSEDYKRASLLVRRNAVANALKCLILNHSDYHDVTFSPNNLNGYSEDLPIVAVEYFRKDTTRNAEGVSVHDDLENDGTEEGECVFTVHGIVGAD
ncbi:hypothetical protein F5877DRAFT_45420, partial [Lentinula edodes]